MRHITRPEERFFLASLLIFIWMSMVFFADTYHRYDKLHKEALLAIKIAETDYQLVNIKKPRCGDFFCVNPSRISIIGKQVEQERLNQGILHEQTDEYISDSKLVDDYVRAFAEKLGYEPHFYADEATLVYENGLPTQTELQNAYHKLRDAMKEDGIALHFVSGYRQHSYQETIFFDRLGIESFDEDLLSLGAYDELLSEVLKRTAPPGYSKHHTGFAVDFACGNEYLVYDFKESICYSWMSENNFERIKKYGFIPSYPEGLHEQGPEPEPWEYVWVGTEVL